MSIRHTILAAAFSLAALPGVASAAHRHNAILVLLVKDVGAPVTLPAN
jgi:hypothetical protein